VAHGRALVETVDGLRAASISAILSLKFPPIEKKNTKHKIVKLYNCC
jgi:hypothetical protein